MIKLIARSALLFFVILSSAHADYEKLRFEFSRGRLPLAADLQRVRSCWVFMENDEEPQHSSPFGFNRILDDIYMHRTLIEFIDTCEGLIHAEGCGTGTTVPQTLTEINQKVFVRNNAASFQWDQYGESFRSFRRALNGQFIFEMSTTHPGYVGWPQSIILNGPRPLYVAGYGVCN